VENQGQTQQIAHLGRLALMGEMAASLAHELNQPRRSGPTVSG
jgi:C4-dicarboxylate-specific signal transduction histidine kinase